MLSSMRYRIDVGRQWTIVLGVIVTAGVWSAGAETPVCRFDLVASFPHEPADTVGRHCGGSTLSRVR
jgi:hypothetical protein